jgi:hypothetical protein
MTHTGPLRVYFNRLSAEPMMWCVSPDSAADGTWEIAVRSVSIGPGLVAETVWRRKDTPDDEDGRPSAWVAVTGKLAIHGDGTATITPP